MVGEDSSAIGPVGSVDNLDLPVAADARWLLDKLSTGLSSTELILVARRAEGLVQEVGGVLVCRSHLLQALREFGKRIPEEETEVAPDE